MLSVETFFDSTLTERACERNSDNIIWNLAIFGAACENVDRSTCSFAYCQISIEIRRKNIPTSSKISPVAQKPSPNHQNLTRFSLKISLDFSWTLCKKKHDTTQDRESNLSGLMAVRQRVNRPKNPVFRNWPYYLGHFQGREGAWCGESRALRTEVHCASCAGFLNDHSFLLGHKQSLHVVWRRRVLNIFIQFLRFW